MVQSHCICGSDYKLRHRIHHKSSNTHSHSANSQLPPKLQPTRNIEIGAPNHIVLLPMSLFANREPHEVMPHMFNCLIIFLYIYIYGFVF